ncbi:MAG: 6-carboxytetrahydropterin synthase [Opitutales bacterium]|nr:6-carboxytetrahydropterin synthase [Opitutales bacterium]
MFSCEKNYNDIACAHVQYKHDGHCRFIHGHNWSFTFVFACDALDEQGFVIDFGKLKFIAAWLDEHLDHACIFDKNDPEAKALVSAFPQLFKPYFVDCASAEGLAKHLHEIFDPQIRARSNGRVWIKAVKAYESSRDAATYEA